jgi:hypothetical protein
MVTRKDDGERLPDTGEVQLYTHADYLRALSSFPLEQMGYGNEKDDRILFGVRGWSLTVGHIRAARAALATRNN